MVSATTISGWVAELEAEDEAGGKGLWARGCGGDAVAEVHNAPVDARQYADIDTSYETADEFAFKRKPIGKVQIAGPSYESFYIGLERNDRKVNGKTWTDKAAFNFAREVGTAIDREGQRAEMGNADVEAEGSSCSPVIGDAGLLAAYRAVDGKFGLGVKSGRGKGEDCTCEKSKSDLFHTFHSISTLPCVVRLINFELVQRL